MAAQCQIEKNIRHTLPETKSCTWKWMVGICCNTSSLLRRPIFRGYVSFRAGISGQIIATFSRRLVTPNDGSIGVFHPKYPNNSGLGIKFILPRYVSMLDVYNVYPASPSRPNYFFGRSKSFTWIIEKTKLAFVWSAGLAIHWCPMKHG